MAPEPVPNDITTLENSKANFFAQTKEMLFKYLLGANSIQRRNNPKRCDAKCSVSDIENNIKIHSVYLPFDIVISCLW